MGWQYASPSLCIQYAHWTVVSVALLFRLGFGMFGASNAQQGRNTGIGARLESK
jgi:hypothetical protein